MPGRAPHGEHWTLLVCLLLEHLGEGEYRRLGVCMTDKRELVDRVLMWDEAEARAPCNSYDAQRGRHTFRVV